GTIVAGHLAHDRTDIRPLTVDRDLSCLCARQLEEVVDQLQRRLDGAPDPLHALALLLGELSADSLLEQRCEAVRGAEWILHVVAEAAHETRATLGHALELLAAPLGFDAGLTLASEQLLALLLVSLPLGDVGRRAEPLDDLSRLVPQRHRLAQEPVILTVGAEKPVLDLVRLPGGQCMLPARAHAFAIVGMEEVSPRHSVRLLG